MFFWSFSLNIVQRFFEILLQTDFMTLNVFLSFCYGYFFTLPRLTLAPQSSSFPLTLPSTPGLSSGALSGGRNHFWGYLLVDIRIWPLFYIYYIYFIYIYICAILTNIPLLLTSNFNS